MLRILPLALLFTACVDESDEPTYGEVESLAIGCPKWGCNENSPVMGPYKFHEVYLPGGLTNDEGVSVDGFWKDGKRYTPYMLAGAELRATNPMWGTLAGHGLEGGYLRLLTPQGAYQLIFKNVSTAGESGVTFWVGTPSGIQTYELEYTGPGAAVAQRVCFNPPNRESGEAPTRTWEAPLESVLYGHERIDSALKEVDYHGPGAQTNGWMTIGCAGSSLAKLHLTRHTAIAGNANGNAMQAMLKMYVSDVCGNGTPFTDQGTPLHWQNTTKTSTLTGNEYAIEALWGPGGALCLDVHRLGWKYDNVNQIGAMCGNKPACPTIDPNASTLPMGAYLVSAVPNNPYPNIPIFPLF